VVGGEQRLQRGHGIPKRVAARGKTVKRGKLWPELRGKEKDKTGKVIGDLGGKE